MKYYDFLTMTARSVIIAGMLSISSGFAQEKPVQVQQAPVVNSAEVRTDHRIVFRIVAPKAESIGLQGSAGLVPPGVLPLVKSENGVWEITVGPVEPGMHRYRFVVDGVTIMDPRNPMVSESTTFATSMVFVPGAEWMETNRVRHGAVAEVYYYSTALGRFRRMHIYTPPGYEGGKGKYPVFYLLHGAGDCDDSWHTVGRAGFILDNLIAAQKAKPMIVVMPAGHTTTTEGDAKTATVPATAGASPSAPREEFLEDFVNDIMPFVEKTYRVLSGRQNRAIAGLSLGGNQALNISFTHLDRFSYVGVFSSGLIGGGAPAARGAAGGTAAPFGSAWEQRHRAMLDDTGLKGGLKLLWFSTGSEDSVLNTTKATIELLKKHGFSPVYEESAGGHTWINWRNYLLEFAQKLF